MHADAAYWALLGDEAAADFPALAALLAAWQGTGARAPRELFEQPPARLAEILGCAEEALPPLLARRPRLAQARRLVERLPAGVDMIARGERRYPRVVLDSLGQGAPRALWYLGPLAVLTGSAIALFGSRDAQQESLVTARIVAGQVAGEGRVLITGIARPLERAALDAALAVGGLAVVVLGMGIAVAQPEIRRLLPHVVGERLLLLSPFGPQTPWQPGLEGRRIELAMALAERAILGLPGEAGDALGAAQIARRLARPLAVWPASAAALTPDALPWTPAPDGGKETAITEDTREDTRSGPGRRGGTEVEEAPRATESRKAGVDRGAAADAAAHARPPSTDTAAHVRPPSSDTVVSGAPSGSIAVSDAASAQAPESDADPAEAVLRYLTHTRRKVTSKGRLLQALGMSEADLDQILPTLIAAGQVVQMRHRSGAGYAAVQEGEPPPAASTFQLSLFGQDAPTQHTSERSRL